MSTCTDMVQLDNVNDGYLGRRKGADSPRMVSRQFISPLCPLTTFASSSSTFLDKPDWVACLHLPLRYVLHSHLSLLNLTLTHLLQPEGEGKSSLLITVRSVADCMSLRSVVRGTSFVWVSVSVFRSGRRSSEVGCRMSEEKSKTRARNW